MSHAIFHNPRNEQGLEHRCGLAHTHLFLNSHKTFQMIALLAHADYNPSSVDAKKKQQDIHRLQVATGLWLVI